MPLRAGPEGVPFVPIPWGASINEVARAMVQFLALQASATGQGELRMSIPQAKEELRAAGYPEEGYPGGVIPEEGAGPSLDDILDQLEIGMGEGGYPRRTIRSLTSTTTTGVTVEEDVKRKERFYVEVPTAERVLDDFQTGFMAFLSGQFKSGGLSTQAYNLAVQNSDFFFNEYLGELGRRADADEEIFKVTGVEGEPTKLGERPGQVTAEETDRTTTVKTEEEAAEEVAPAPGEPGEPTGQETTAERIEETATEARAGLTTTEEIFQRPELRYIATLSPMDYLEQRFGRGAQAQEILKQSAEGKGPGAITALKALQGPNMLETFLRSRFRPPQGIRGAIQPRRV